MSYNTAFQQTEMSYELYQEIADELSSPVDPRLPTQVRYELYTSKLVFLRNLFDQCFRIVNQPFRVTSFESSFSASDLNLIHDAVSITHTHLRETILESLNVTLNNLKEATVHDTATAR